MYEQTNVRGILAVVTVMGLIACAPTHLKAQWQFAGGYSFMNAAPHRAVAGTIERRLTGKNRYSLSGRLAAEKGNDVYRGVYFHADTRVLRAHGALTVGTQISRLHISAGLLGGLEHFARTVEKTDPNVFPDLARPPNLNETVPYVGGLVEIDVDLVGPVRPFAGVRQEYVLHDNISSQRPPQLWNHRRHVRSAAIGVKITI